MNYFFSPYRYAGDATAAGAEALPSPQERLNVELRSKNPLNTYWFLGLKWHITQKKFPNKTYPVLITMAGFYLYFGSPSDFALSASILGGGSADKDVPNIRYSDRH